MSKSSDRRSKISLLLLLISVAPFTEKYVAYGSSITAQIARRPDPLRKFRHYGGGYDISSKHYWASAAFTGIHGYAVAGIWLLCGLGFGLFIVVRNIKGSSSSTVVDRSSSSNMIILSLFLIVTVLAIIAGGVSIAENRRSLKRAKMLEKTILGAGNSASSTIAKVVSTLQQMQTSLQPYNSNICNQLNVTAHRLKKTSLNIHAFVRSSLETWDRAIQILYVANLVVVSLDLALLVAGLVLLSFHFQLGVILLIFTCWILTTLSWILTGVDFVFHTFIGDTCSVLKNYENDPGTNSLGNMLPCPKSTDYVQTLQQINNHVHGFIAEINWKIREVIESKYRDEDMPGLEVCDPFPTSPNDSFSLRNCPDNSIPIENLPGVLSTFVCHDSPESCRKEGKFLPESIYTISLAYSQSIQKFIDMYPDLSSLMKCTPVKRAFSEIIERQCGPIEQSTKELWAWMLGLSAVMVVLVLLWVYLESQGNNTMIVLGKLSIFSS